MIFFCFYSFLRSRRLNDLFPVQALQRVRSHFSSLPITVLLASFVIGLTITFVASHFIIQHSDKKQLSSYLDSVSETSKNLGQTITQVFNTTSSNLLQTCTKADLRRMRGFLWNHSQLKEVARIQDGNVVCSASWGMLSPPIPLPEPTEYWSNIGLSHWRDVKDAIQGTVNVNMVSNDNMLVVVSPYAYMNIQPVNEHVGFIMTFQGLDYVAKSSGPLDPKSVLQTNASASLAMLKQQSCTTSPGYVCLTVYNYKSGLFGKDKVFITMVTAIAIVFSVLIYISLLSFLNYRGSMRKALKHALEKKELFVVFQPKLNIRTGEVIGMEALARWHHAQFGHVPPDVFVTIAEEYGFMPKLSRLIIKKSLSDAAQILQQIPNLTLSINLSMADLSDPMLLDFIDFQCNNYDIRAQQLTFEIIETSAVGFEKIGASVERFVSRGYSISLDDFGTGYANLSWLSKIKASEIKVDRSFTQMIGSQDSNHTKTLHAIFKLVKNLKMSTVFEGIETQEQADYIQSHIEDAVGQGWLYAKPMPINQLCQYINQHPHPLTREGSAQHSHHLICGPLIP